MPLTNLLLTIHVIGAIAIFGATFSFPFIGALAQKEGAPVAWALGLVDFISSKWVEPLAATVMPASGALLIVHNHWSPWKSQNRWLLAGIILYTIAFAFANRVQARNGRKALHLAQANQFGPEFGALMKKVKMGGQFLTLAVIAIAILMVTKPGSGYFHP